MKAMISFGAAIFAVIVLLSMSADITADVQADVACPTDYTYIQNVTHPNGRCCGDSAAGRANCSSVGTGNSSAFSIAGNTTLDGQAGMMNLSAQIPNIGLIVAVMVILGVIVGFGGFVMLMSRR